MAELLLIHCPPDLDATDATEVVYGSFPLLQVASLVRKYADIPMIDASGLGQLVRVGGGFKVRLWETALEAMVAESGAQKVVLHLGQVHARMPDYTEQVADWIRRLHGTGCEVWLIPTAPVFTREPEVDAMAVVMASDGDIGIIPEGDWRAVVSLATGEHPYSGELSDDSPAARIQANHSLPDDLELMRSILPVYQQLGSIVWADRSNRKRFPVSMQADEDAYKKHFRLLNELGISAVDFVGIPSDSEANALPNVLQMANEKNLTSRILSPLSPSLVTEELVRADWQGNLPLEILSSNLILQDTTEKKWVGAVEKALLHIQEKERTATFHVMFSEVGHSLRSINTTLRRVADWEETFGARSLGRWIPHHPEEHSHISKLVHNYFSARLGSEGEEKLIINVSYKCNNHCVFCSVADRKCEHGDLDVQKRHIDEAAAAGVELLDIDGGEPTLYPHLFELLDHAIGAGMRRITITSNGRMLSDANLVERLAAYPIHLLVSLHSGIEAVHDDLTRNEGSFRQTVRGIMNALKKFPELGVNTTLLRSNLSSMEQTARLLVKLGVRTWNIQYYTPFGEVKPEIAPDPHEAGEKVSAVIRAYHDLLAIQVINLPFCFLPELEENALQDYNKSVRRMLFVSGEEVNLANYLAEKRFKNGKCTVCPYDPVCNGFWDFDKQMEGGWRIRMLDVIPGYPCSADCSFCGVEDDLLPIEMDTETVANEIDRAMAYGPTVIRFGGGEPTDREDLPQLIRLAKDLEIETISIQTHGFRLADEHYLDQLLQAGVNKINISVRGSKADVHEELTRSPGSFEKVVAAIGNIAAKQPEITLELDSILTQQTVPNLAEDIRFFNNLGARRFNFWFVTAEGRAAKNWCKLVPNMTETAQAIKQAAKQADKLGCESFRVYYIPYCFFKDQEQLVWHPLEERALVVTPNSRFTLDKGTLDLGVKASLCQNCAIQNECFGIAPSYLKHAGDMELSPFTAIPKGIKPYK